MTPSLKAYLFGIFMATVLSWAAFVLIIFNVNPYSTSRWILFLFFLCLFLALVGTITLIGFYLRFWFSKKEIGFAHIGPSIRQAILLSLCVITLLALQILRLVNIWTGILLVLAILSLEFFFRTKKEKVKKVQG